MTNQDRHEDKQNPSGGQRDPSKDKDKHDDQRGQFGDKDQKHEAHGKPGHSEDRKQF